MKLLKLLLLSLVLANVGSISAQEVEENRLPEERAKLQTKNMTELLDLSEEQIPKVYELNLIVANKIDVIKNDASMSPEKKKEFIDGNHKDQVYALKSLLTEEQYDKLKQSKAKKRESHNTTIK
jgi:hypothetical protein